MLDGRGADLFMLETFFDLEELVDAIAAVRSVSSLPIVALLTFDEEAETLAGVTRAPGGGTARRARHRRVRREPRRRPARRADRARADAGDRPAARGPPEHRSREPARRQGDLPARDARVLRRVRGARARPRRARDRRLLRHDSRRDRGDPRGDRRAAARADPARRGRAEVAVALGEEQRETGLATALREGEFVVSVQLDPPLGGSSRGPDRGRAGARGLGPRQVRRRQRQRDRPRRDQRPDGVGRDRASDRASRRSRT